jgi:O-antigen/teichoic acid export membrane protein
MPSDKVAMQRTFFKNSLFGLLSWLLPIIPTFIATPIVVKTLGDKEYGVLVVIIGFISYFFTTAIGKVAAKYVAEYTANGENEKISAIISGTLIFGFLTTLAGSLATVFLARFIVESVLFIEPGLRDEAVVGLYLAAATILAIVIGQVFQLVLQGLHRFDRFLFLANLSSVSFSIGSIVLVLLGYGVVALLWWNLATWLIVCAASYVAAKRALPEFQFTLHISGPTYRNIITYGLGLMAFQVFGNVLLLFERSWIMAQFGGEALTYYVIPMSLAMYVHMFVSSLVLAMFPKVNELLNRPEQLVRLYRRATKVVVGVVFFALACSIGGGYALLSLWLDKTYADASYRLLVIHTATFAILAIHTVAWQIAESFRSARVNAIATAVWMLVGITLMIMLSQSMDSLGVSIGRFVGVLTFIAAIGYTERSFLGGVFLKFWASTLIRTFFSGSLAVATLIGILWLTGRSWPGLIAGVAAAGAIYLGSLLLTGYLDDDDKRILRETFSGADSNAQARA